MTNPRGTRWETRLVDWLRAHGHPTATRLPRLGRNDMGDVSVMVDGRMWGVIEAKNCKRVELAAWLDEAEKEAANAEVTRYCVMFPRRNHTVDDGFCVMPIWLAAELLS